MHWLAAAVLMTHPYDNCDSATRTLIDLIIFHDETRLLQGKLPRYREGFGQDLSYYANRRDRIRYLKLAYAEELASETSAREILREGFDQHTLPITEKYLNNYAHVVRAEGLRDVDGGQEAIQTLLHRLEYLPEIVGIDEKIGFGR